MKFQQCVIPGVVLIEPDVFVDERGFLEVCNHRQLKNAGIKADFVQENFSRSQKNVLRGLHYQINYSQGKLVRVTRGEVFDVVVDLRRSSPTFGKWHSQILSEYNRQLLWVPEGCAHGYLTLSDISEFQYSLTEEYFAGFERCLFYNDAELAIDWPLPAGIQPILSPKDKAGKSLSQSQVFS
ncbi:MAG: dTDP-4-dehydrorhamnose 3,5-epimerase [Candidatus Riflebacteria bacterium]|nr:dTDP-4-dehydrorhamnose 3,5-epimerase [Candidatus Riflebacteria bacterium]